MRPLCTFGLLILMTSVVGGGACAQDFKLYQPEVEAGEWDLETRLGDPRGEELQTSDQVLTAALGYGLTPWWSLEIEGEWEKEVGGSRRFEELVIESVLQADDEGWFKWGAFGEYAMPTDSEAGDEIVLGAILQAAVHEVLVTGNLRFSREVGSDASAAVEVGYASELRWHLSGPISPAVQAFGEMGKVSDAFENLSAQIHYAGPVAVGEFHLARAVTLSYEAGYLLGLTRGSPEGAWKAMLELGVEF